MEISFKAENSQGSERSAKPRRRLSERSFGPLTGGSQRSSILALAATAFGSGILALPWLFGQLGIVLGLAVIAFGGFASLLSQRLLVNAAYATGLSTYTDITNHALGKKASIALEAIVCCSAFGAVVSYFVFLGQFVPELCKDLHLPKFLVSSGGGKFWVSIILAIFPSTPLCCLRSLASLSYATLLSIASLSVVCIIIVCTFASMHEELIDHETSLNINEKYYWLKPHISDWKIIPACIAVSFFSFCCHLNFFAKYRELDSPTSSRVQKVLYRAVYLEGIIYAFVGICGNLALGEPCTVEQPEHAWPSCTPVNILASPRFNGTVGIITRVCMLLTLCVSIPLNHAAGREILEARILAWQGQTSILDSSPSSPSSQTTALSLSSPSSNAGSVAKPRLSTFSHLTLSSLYLWLAVITAITFDDLKAVLGILGGFCSVSFMFTVPAAISLVLYFGRAQMPDGSFRHGISGDRRLEGTDQIGSFWGVTKTGVILACILLGNCIFFGYTAASFEVAHLIMG
jgi:amino acid permease